MAISPSLSVNRVKTRVHLDAPESHNREEGFGGEYPGGIGRDPDSFGVVFILVPLNLFPAATSGNTPGLPGGNEYYPKGRLGLGHTTRGECPHPAG